MTSLEAAQIYTDLVALHDGIPEEESVSKQEIGIFRSKYHQILMDQFRADGIEFVDRFEAARLALEMVNATQEIAEWDANAKGE